jgi:hypothetical protein
MDMVSFAELEACADNIRTAIEDLKGHYNGIEPDANVALQPSNADSESKYTFDCMRPRCG